MSAGEDHMPSFLTNQRVLIGIVDYSRLISLTHIMQNSRSPMNSQLRLCLELWVSLQPE
jgi:hypothetical protein